MSQALSTLATIALATGEPAALVTIRDTRGSTPREAGARMLVTADAASGTIGGGRLEWDAIEAARQLLLATGERERILEMALGPDIGQCCGGHVTLAIERLSPRIVTELAAEERRAAEAAPSVLVFGAGHVGHALVRALVPLPFRTRWIDTRPGAFGPSAGGRIELTVTDSPGGEVERAEAGSAFVVLTHSHALDSLIAAAVLERGDFAYLGVIGSKTKRVLFERAFRDIGIGEDRIARMVCPIGDRGVRDKRPEIIAALVAADLVVALAEPGS